MKVMDRGRGRRRTPARRLAGLSLALMLLPAAAQAARFIPVEDECNGRQLLIQGPIEPGDHQRFLDFMAAHVAGDRPAVQDPDVLWTVELDSAGGDLTEAMRIGRFLREAYATTEVGYRYARRPDGVWDFARSSATVCLDGRDRLSGCHADLVEAECTGACLLIWLGGAARHANEGRLGAHGLDGGNDLAAYLAQMEVPPAWIARLDAPPESGDGWLSWPERHELGGSAPMLEALIAGCPPPLSREESYQSVTAASAARRDALMDRADAHRSCRRSHLAATRGALVARLRARHDGATVAVGSD